MARGQGPDWRIDAIWDIECSQWDQFYCGCLWTKDDGIEVYTDPEDLADALMSLPKGYQTWGHYAGKYDNLWLFDHVTNRKQKPPPAVITMSGSSASSVKFKDRLHLRDSGRLIPMSLAKAARIAGPGRRKGDPGLPCVCGDDCGGYCSIGPKMSKRDHRKVIDYQVDDVELLRDVMLGIESYALNHEIELRGTVGGTAWSTAKEWCDLPDAEWSREMYYRVRDAYYGGRCEIGITQAREIWRYDRKSAYPAALKRLLPTGDMIDCDSPTAASKAWRKGRPGIYQVQVDIPESHTPPLPYRYKGRLTYPYGVIMGSWTHVELRHAEAQGAKILQFIDAVVWEAEEAIMEPFTEKCFELRDEIPHDKGCTKIKCSQDCNKGSLGTWLKFVANSGIGKLGQSPDHETIVLGDYADDDRYSMVGSSPWVWARDLWRIPSCGHVEWAAVGISYARVEFNLQQIHAGSDWAMGDTDSCFATRKLTRNLGNDLGDWAFEGHAAPPPNKKDHIPGFEGMGWVGIAPKVYAYYDWDKKEWISHAKGVPSSGDIDRWTRYTSGEQVEDARGVHGLKTAAKQDRLFKRRKLTRSMRPATEWCGARLRDGNVTLPPHVSDLVRLPG